MTPDPGGVLSEFSVLRRESAADGDMSGLADAAIYVFWRDRLAPHIAEAQIVPELAALPLAGLAWLGAMLLSKSRSARPN